MKNDLKRYQNDFKRLVVVRVGCFLLISVTMYKVDKCMISRVFKLRVFLLIDLKLICIKYLFTDSRAIHTECNFAFKNVKCGQWFGGKILRSRDVFFSIEKQWKK